jgi:hypothetical protein
MGRYRVQPTDHTRASVHADNFPAFTHDLGELNGKLSGAAAKVDDAFSGLCCQQLENRCRERFRVSVEATRLATAMAWYDVRDLTRKTPSCCTAAHHTLSRCRGRP